MKIDKNHAHWSSKFTFLMAAIGSAVGLGNFWRFPYEAGENGGGAFVILYVACVIFIGVPVLMSELFIGRRGGSSAVSSVNNVSEEIGASKFWSIQSWLGMLGSFVILTFYCVIAGWLFAYAVIFLKDIFASFTHSGFAGIAGGAFVGQSEGEIKSYLSDLLSSPTRMIFYHFLFAAITGFIVARGVKEGIEGAVSILMPAFFILFLVVIFYSIFTGDTSRTFDYLFSIRLSDLTHGLSDGSIITAALGQAFFSIGLGSALMITYGSYLSKDTNIPVASLQVGFCDTIVAILAGLAIFPLVFAFGLEPNAGPTLLFQSLPLSFTSIPFGSVIGFVFFVLAIFAALSSSIALLEAVVAWGDEVSEKIKRGPTVVIVVSIIFLIGIGNILSQVPVTVADTFFNSWKPLDFYVFKGQTLLDFFDSLSGELILPLAGLFTAIYAGWILPKKLSQEELGLSDRYFKIWHFLIKYVCPISVTSILVYSLLIPLFNN